MKELQPELMYQEKANCKLLLIVQPTWYFILFYAFEALVLCIFLRIMLMFFNYIQKLAKWKKCKVDKRLELALYRKPIIKISRIQMYVKILICSK